MSPKAMSGPDREKLSSYLSSFIGKRVREVRRTPLGETVEAGAVKGYGYGVPLLVEFEVSGERRKAVLETMSPGPFGHEHMADRAQMLLWDHRAYNRLPLHARSLDVGAFAKDGTLHSLGNAEEFFLLVEFVEGRAYVQDLARLQAGGTLSGDDLARADALCDYLADIHRVKGPDPGLYVRRIRELIGHGECVMGLLDSYPPRHGFITPDLLAGIERRCVAWRWRIKGRTHRLRQVHGDFHPYNILFGEGTRFRVLDRSRGEWGDPADDVTSLTGNYLFCSLQRSGKLSGPFEILFRRFWDRYLEKTGDREMLEVAAPFFAFRGLVMASPLWYPTLDEGVRRKLFSFIGKVLDAEAFDPGRVNGYCGIR
ncbi:MAG TPA: aminoglycoside phosphotransferase family protein [Candidatus Deferrimicrobiaceae bacterium]|nr:aminoglycoside phosphotransferase family protein [Candidatus Deferrimicrobiaceae bacterium]